jgi:Flp pilus assembly protein TadG
MTDASPPRPTAPWRRFAAARGGVAAVEFALLVPVVLAMMAAAVDLTQAISIKRKLVEIAYTASDLVAQRSALTAADVSSILTGSSAILLPNSTTNLDIVLSALNISGSKNIVAWASAVGTTAPAAGSTLTSVTVPSDIVVSGVQIIAAQVSYTYQPPFSGLFGSTVSLSTVNLARPRTSKTVTLN